MTVSGFCRPSPAAAGWALLGALLVPPPLAADFYSWTDAGGQPRVSNVLPRGVRTDGSIDPAFHPGGFARQEAALRARLRERDEALARAAAAPQSGPVAVAPGSVTAAGAGSK